MASHRSGASGKRPSDTDGPDRRPEEDGDPRVVRAVVGDNNRLIVGGIRRALERDEEIQIVGEAYSAAEVLPLVQRTRPDVVLLSLDMPKIDGMRLLDQIRAQFPDTRVVVLSAQSVPEDIQAAIAHGASGYIMTTINPRDIPSALRQAVEGNVYHVLSSTELARPAGSPESLLTERELTILRAVARGLSNQAIGRELWVTEQTVKFHLTNIYRKLGVTNRTEAARYAYAHHLATPDGDSVEGHV